MYNFKLAIQWGHWKDDTLLYFTDVEKKLLSGKQE